MALCVQDIVVLVVPPEREGEGADPPDQNLAQPPVSFPKSDLI